MAALIGYLSYDHHAQQVSRLSHNHIDAKVATWKGSVSVSLDRYGNASVDVNGKEVWNGNVGGATDPKKDPWKKRGGD